MNSGTQSDSSMKTTNLPGIGIKPLLSLKRHYRVSIVVWFVVFFAGLPMVWIKGQSLYIAESIFQVSPTYMKNLDTDREVELQSNSQYREYVNHLSKTVTRYDVIEHAILTLRDENIDIQPAGMSERKFIEKLQRDIYVRSIPDTYMVKIGIESQDNRYLSNIVNAVTDSFLATTRSEQIFGAEDRLKVIEENSNRLRAEIAAFETQRVALAEKLGLTTFTEATQNPFDAILQNMRERLTTISVERSDAQAAYDAFMSQREIPTQFGRSLLEMKLQDNGLQSLRNEIIKRTEELSRQLSGIEPRHPNYAPAMEELTLITKRLAEQEARFDENTFENFRSRLIATLDQKTQVQTELKASLANLEGQASDFARNFQTSVKLTAEIRTRNDDLQQLRARLKYLSNESNAIGFVRLVTPALPAETPFGLGKTKILMLLLLAATGLSLVAPIGVDMLDRRIRSVNDAEKLMGIPSAGWQIREEDLPTIIFAESQTRRFVSTLIRNALRTDRHTYAFAPVKATSGVTKILLDTANILKELGLNVLIVEADSFAPFADFVDSHVGLSDYLAGLASLDELPQAYAYKDLQLSIISIGKHKKDGLKRLDLFKSAIATWSAQYDYVLFDLPPLLLSADSELLIEAIGQVFLVVEADNVTKGEVTRAKRLLEKINPDAVGLFVNDIPLFRGGGYMEELILETLTGHKFSSFNTLSGMRLRWQTLLTKWSTYRRDRRGTGDNPSLGNMLISVAILRWKTMLENLSLYRSKWTGRQDKRQNNRRD